MNRLTQPSTWAGVGVLAQVIKGLSPTYGILFDAISAAAGALAAGLNEKSQAEGK